ncbi:MAG: hypothetical protein SFV51_29855 [Bryobacteraceae bacterium]|nr:hypothetical protein [Bryobacteraceae bacterium]
MNRTAILCVAALSSMLGAQDLSSYRGFRLGTGLAAVAKQTGVNPASARVAHQRPARIEELEWRPASSQQTGKTGVDPVRDGLLRFYKGELFQIITTYDRQRVEGMSDADMVKAISTIYGTATTPVAASIPFRSNYGESAAVIARWENAEYSHNLVRTGDQASFALILSSKRLDALAQAAILEALRLDVIEAPQKAIDEQKKQDAGLRLVQEKARSVNLPNFRP